MYIVLKYMKINKITISPPKRFIVSRGICHIHFSSIFAFNFQEQMKYQSYNNKSDIWSLGCLLYELCALRPPFTASSQNELSEKICKGLCPRLPQRYSDDLYMMIATMIRVDVSGPEFSLRSLNKKLMFFHYSV